VYLVHELSCMPSVSPGISRGGWQTWSNQRAIRINSQQAIRINKEKSAN
ncbi:MAG: hypothetical protein RLZZ616_2366, partial [Pseudomonadota bacterium]